MIEEDCKELIEILENTNNSLPNHRRTLKGFKWGYLRRFND